MENQALGLLALGSFRVVTTLPLSQNLPLLRENKTKPLDRTEMRKKALCNGILKEAHTSKIGPILGKKKIKGKYVFISRTVFTVVNIFLISSDFFFAIFHVFVYSKYVFSFTARPKLKKF